MADSPKFAWVALICLLACACNTGSDDNQAANDAATNEIKLPLPPKPVSQPPLGREAMLMAVAKAASSFALGQDDSEQQRLLDGRQFEFRMRFGCRADEPDDGSSPFSVAYDEKARTLRISAAPGVQVENSVIAAVTHDQVEAVEGFWVERPWLLAAACRSSAQPAAAVPATASASASAAPTAETTAATARPGPKPSAGDTTTVERVPAYPRVGIAQFFGADESRTRRRNSRAYQVTKTLPEGVSPSAVGYDIVLAGRLRKLPDGKVITCSGETPETPPSCVVSVSFDTVSVRRGDNDQQLAEWGGG